MEGLKDGGLALMINPQWQGGNLVNDFGVGPWRRRSEDFVGSFQEVYILKQMRILGDNVRCARQHQYLQACVHDENGWIRYNSMLTPREFGQKGGA